MNKEMVAVELLRIAEELIAMDFPTQDAYDKYMKDHPEADKSNHRVVDTKKYDPDTSSGSWKVTRKDDARKRLEKKAEGMGGLSRKYPGLNRKEFDRANEAEEKLGSDHAAVKEFNEKLDSVRRMSHKTSLNVAENNQLHEKVDDLEKSLAKLVGISKGVN